MTDVMSILDIRVHCHIECQREAFDCITNSSVLSNLLN